MARDYMSFDEVLSELNLRSAELKRLMSEGQIRGIRDGANIKFRREEVEGLAQNRAAGAPEDILFVDEEEGAEGMATAQISEEDTLLEAAPEEEEEISLAVEEDQGAARRARARASLRGRAPEPEPEGEGALEKAVLIVTALVMIYGVMTVMAAMRAQTDGMTSFIAGMFK